MPTAAELVGHSLASLDDARRVSSRTDGSAVEAARYFVDRARVYAMLAGVAVMAEEGARWDPGGP